MFGDPRYDDIIHRFVEEALGLDGLAAADYEGELLRAAAGRGWNIGGVTII